MPGKQVLAGPPRRGGKNGNGATGVGRWVASLLPTDLDVLYTEPFCGMLGVLLQRPRANAELVNDLDGNVMNWWRCVRDEPAEMARLLAMTPSARAEHEWALGALDDPAEPPLRRALAYMVILLQAHPTRRTGAPTSWFPIMDPTHGTAHNGWRAEMDERVALLAERLRNVHLESTDAVALMNTTRVNRPDAVVYCDPPYADTVEYELAVDRGALRAALLAQRGRVLISGYGDEWDDLGWRKQQRASRITSLAMSPGGATPTPKATRLESAWANYDPPQASMF